jgi:hypothetical protein
MSVPTHIAKGKTQPFRPILQSIIGIIPTAPEFCQFLASDTPVKRSADEFTGICIGEFHLNGYFPTPDCLTVAVYLTTESAIPMGKIVERVFRTGFELSASMIAIWILNPDLIAC